jgi:endonuclease/exonuclease/phosphatase family metal-dependent hydrolase
MRALVVCWLLAVGAAACPSEQTRRPAGMPAPPTTSLRLVTYNLYLGADLVPLLSGAIDPRDVGGVVATTFAAVQATDPPARADAWAAELAAVQPDLVALQEVALWRTQSPGDGAATAATVVAYDFLQLLVDALGRRGLIYRPAIVAEHTDVEAAGDFPGMPMDVRFTDRDAILVNADAGLAIVGTDEGTFTAELVIPTIAFGTVSVPRGWVAVDISVAGQMVRIVGTHLEAVAPPIRDAQAIELVAGPASGSPLILAGDFNFDPGALAYRGFVAGGLLDEWARVQPGDAGPTCCQAADLRNPASQLDQRIDLVFTRGPLAASTAERIGEDPADRTPSGLWPSDHAGVSMQIAPAP